MDLAAAAPRCRAIRLSLLRAGWSNWRTWAGANPRQATELLRYRRERTDASVRRTGLGATTCGSRRGTCRVTIVACWEHHFFLANRERFRARFDLLRPLFLENDLVFRRYR